MKTQVQGFSSSVLVSLALIASTSLLGCSQPAAHVGDKVEQAKLASGTATVSESRYLLANGKIGGDDTALIEVTGTVANINRSTRAITIRSEDGKLHEIKAGDEVRNFNQIAKGDK